MGQPTKQCCGSVHSCWIRMPGFSWIDAWNKNGLKLPSINNLLDYLATQDQNEYIGFSLANTCPHHFKDVRLTNHDIAREVPDLKL